MISTKGQISSAVGQYGIGQHVHEFRFYDLLQALQIVLALHLFDHECGQEIGHYAHQPCYDGYTPAHDLICALFAHGLHHVMHFTDHGALIFDFFIHVHQFLFQEAIAFCAQFYMRLQALFFYFCGICHDRLFIGHTLKPYVAAGFQDLYLPCSFVHARDHGYSSAVSFQAAKHVIALGQAVFLIYAKLKIPQPHVSGVLALWHGYRMRQGAQAYQLIDGIPVALLIA